MIGHISSLFFNLGLHIGLHIENTNTTMYSFLFGFRYSRAIFNPIISLATIRKIALFFLLSSKLNRSILPVIRNKEISLNSRFLEKDNKQNGKVTVNHDNTTDLFRVFSLKFFRMYRIPTLLNKIGLLGWWLIYYKVLKTSIYGYYHEYKKKGFRHLFSLAPLFLKLESFNNKRELKKFFSIEKKKSLTKNMIALLTIFYLRLYDSVFGDIRILKFKVGRYIRRFRKFFAFFKLLLFLRKYTIFPNILFYLNPTNSELLDSKMFRICSIALINSDSNASIPLYPIPLNNNTSLSKIFFCNLFVHFYYVGRILLILSII